MSESTWTKGDPIRTSEDYLASLRGRNLDVWLFGERVEEPVDHPIIRPSINAIAETFNLAEANPELATAKSSISGERVNRFLHITESVEDVVAQNRMQRELGRMTGTCFQRCVGMDANNALFSVTYDIDQVHATNYHERFRDFLAMAQRQGFVLGGAMTDVKGDRSKGPSQQADPDMYVRIVERREDGIVIRGAKAHQTGCINSHWILVMPTMRLTEDDKDWAVVCAIDVEAPGLTFVYGRQACDTRAMEDGDIDVGNAKYSGQEAMIILEDVFVPWEHVFLDGEHEFAASLVERFTAYHRRSYVCKAGVGDVLIGAAALVAEYNGVENASHIKDKLVEMTHLNETIYGTGIAASHESHQTAAGNFENDGMLANVTKHHVTRFPFELGRLAQDLAGGLVATLPSEAEFRDERLGPLLEKYLKGKDDVPTEHRVRALRLIENMTMGRNAVGYLTESLHGAGSPQAQRVQIARLADFEDKKRLAKHLAGIEETPTDPAPDPATD
ncbi:MAG: 4-hydroxybutyryl-CoA dehydratase/vinylacetyl-CoA-Delta-isomerase [Glaciecola sp.]|jgi:4-hydroxybutyryl-CoA dehydratase/vinylacetyl-CoA-Delta-isomerase